MEIKKYIAENEPKMLEDLFSLIRIPSISARATVESSSIPSTIATTSSRFFSWRCWAAGASAISPWAKAAAAGGKTPSALINRVRIGAYVFFMAKARFLQFWGAKYRAVRVVERSF